MMPLPFLPTDPIVITDTTLRDGLQSLADVHPLETKLAVLEAITDAGLRSIELTSFVRPDRVPQLADAEELAARARARFGDGLELRALVANRRGLDRAASAGVDLVVILVTLSDEYARRNQGLNSGENLNLACALVEAATAQGMAVATAYSMPIFCPYEGTIPPERLAAATKRLVVAGCSAFTLCTSTGLEGLAEVDRSLSLMRDSGAPDVALHLHTTNGMALAVALLGLQRGITRFETAMCGLGGGIALPDDMPEHGNLATEDLAHLLFELDLAEEPAPIIAAARKVARRLGVIPRSFAARGATKSSVHASADLGGRNGT